MHPFNEIMECLCIGQSSTRYDVVEEQPDVEFLHEKKHPPQTTQSLAEDILSILYAADANDDNLVHRIQDIVRETGWYDSLAAAVLTGLENALKTEAPMGQAMRDAYDKVAKVVEEIWQFAKDHPVFVAVVALGILVVLAPWAIEVLGFGELGPIEGMSCWSLYIHVLADPDAVFFFPVGTFAAWWQSTYGGYVPAGSLFSFFQRLGMVWKW